MQQASDVDGARGFVLLLAPASSPLAAVAAGLPGDLYDFSIVGTTGEMTGLMADNASILAVVLDGSSMADPEAEGPYFSQSFIRDGGPVILFGAEGYPALKRVCADLNVCQSVAAADGVGALYSAICAEVEDYRLRLSVRRAVEEGTADIGEIDAATFRFRTRQEAKNLATMLASACADRMAVAIGLTELFVNAVEHGCLSIGHGEKGRLIEKGRLSDEIRHRRSLSEYENRYATVEFSRTTDVISFLVTDPGDGFDHEAFVAETDGHAKKHGRGIMMAGGCFDELTYVGKGNQVLAIHRLKKA